MSERTARLRTRLALLEAVEAAAEQRHAVLDVVADARDDSEAEAALISMLDVETAGARAILDLRLVRLTGRESEARRREIRELRRALGAES